MRRLLPVIAVASLLAPVAVGEGAAAKKSKRKLWATVNVCDTRENPDEVGLRASMPGNGRAGSMHMRFRLQYYSRRDRHWHNVGEGADSGWVRAGSSQFKRRETGWSFKIVPPPSGGSYVVRGRVDFRWIDDGKVLKRKRRFTEKGFRSASGADPKNYSAAICEIR